MCAEGVVGELLHDEPGAEFDFFHQVYDLPQDTGVARMSSAAAEFACEQEVSCARCEIVVAAVPCLRGPWLLMDLKKHICGP